MKRKLFVGVLAMAMLASLAGSATAEDSDAGTFNGVLTVGKTFRQINTGEKGLTLCTQQNAHKIIAWGRGLFFPSIDNTLNEREKNGTWQLKAGLVSANPLRPPAQLDACGFLQRDCGNLESHGGVGKVRFGLTGSSSKAAKQVYSGQILRLRYLEWIISAGGTLPVTGEYEEASTTGGKPATKTDKGKGGTIIAEVQAQGGIECAEPKVNDPDPKVGGGAKSFVATGVYELINSL